MQYHPTHPHLGQWAYNLSRPLIQRLLHHATMHRTESHPQALSLRQKLAHGEPVYLVGVGAGGHNAGVALVEVTAAHGVNLRWNNEEERFSGQKHYADYPARSIEELRHQLERLHLRPTDIHAWLTSWDYIALLSHSVRTFFEEFPHNWELLKPQPRSTFITDYQAVVEALSAPRRLAKQLGLPKTPPFINLRHHDNHAYFAFAVSPFARTPHPTMVAVVDGSGDDGSVSLYLGQKGRLTLIYNNASMFDSLGTFYSMLSASQGGWSPLSSEGRYMGAAAWGDQERATNPYYQPLRQIFQFDEGGQVRLNRTLAHWHRAGYGRPYSTQLTTLLGEPILPADFWNPDKLLQVEATALHHPPATQAHVDKAAATQLVFEDALFHIIDHFIRQSGTFELVLSGGTALNCVANMRLLARFDEAYYERVCGQTNRHLQLWVPPIPGDAGTPVGAAYHFALRHGQATVGQPLSHAFYCGLPATTTDIERALQRSPDIEVKGLGVATAEIADLLAFMVAQGGIVGLYQGVAETGPRALGHRSILANPTDPTIRQQLNDRVKYREAIRPLAPMLTMRAAQRWFELAAGASAANFNAYNYMVLTTPAKAEAYHRIPAVIHKDGTSRLQIVRPEIDPFTHAYLERLGHYIGVEISVNTSLNVGSPIVQTPTQAIEAMRRAAALTALLFISETGEAFLAWQRPSEAEILWQKWVERSYF